MKHHQFIVDEIKELQQTKVSSAFLSQEENGAEAESLVFLRNCGSQMQRAFSVFLV